jgi:hypothetical protein
MVVWLPLFTIVCMLLLRPVKGAVVGWMGTLGFLQDEPDAAALARPPATPAVAARGQAPDA